jgi:hypothetical protein
MVAGLPRNSFFILLLVCLVIAVCSLLPITTHSSGSKKNEFDSVQSRMYQSKEFSSETYSFTPYDKFYILIDFRYLQAGKYTLLTDWITPWDTLEHQNSHTFEIVQPIPSYKVFSWLSLWKNGPFKRMISGEDFKKEFYGSWQVVLYLNGKQVGRHKFEVH